MPTFPNCQRGTSREMGQILLKIEINWVVLLIYSNKNELSEIILSLHEKDFLSVRDHSSITSSWFWPFLTHPPYHQTSSFPIPTLKMLSSFPKKSKRTQIIFSNDMKMKEFKSCSQLVNPYTKPPYGMM